MEDGLLDPRIFYTMLGHLCSSLSIQHDLITILWIFSRYLRHLIYFQKSFSPVAKVVTVRILLIVAVANSLVLYQLDISNALLHCHLEDKVYMEAPEGYDKVGEGEVCKLKMSLYA